ncbi:unnamed protein product [Cuscuta campestris]|uniref:Uncharacterized protein n=1 Tax=Cuscuta campestris TaxID=132261 RepID=A0A484N4K1_9ASTE|nr:unnamed protein product [Cuscuta campestris]
MISLLDRYHQAVAFKDMVIAVRMKSTQAVSDYSCNGRHVFSQTRELERPLVGSILQSMWGVSPKHLLWGPKHNSTFVDDTWSVGNTPFRPFSDISSLSFVQKDAARRNVLLTNLNSSLTSAIDVVESIAASFLSLSNGGICSNTSWIRQFLLCHILISRWHCTISGHQIIICMLLTLLFTALHKFWRHPLFAGIFIGLLYIFAKREKLFWNKRKQF